MQNKALGISAQFMSLLSFRKKEEDIARKSNEAGNLERVFRISRVVFVISVSNAECLVVVQ